MGKSDQILAKTYNTLQYTAILICRRLTGINNYGNEFHRYSGKIGILLKIQ